MEGAVAKGECDQTQTLQITASGEGLGVLNTSNSASFALQSPLVLPIGLTKQ